MFIPGRIEFLGKHTDYCGGSSIVCAIERGFHAEVEPRSDQVLSVENGDTGETVSIDLYQAAPIHRHWGGYAAEVVTRLAANFASRRLRGATLRFTSDLPRAAGLSSSSALMIMVFAALDAVNDLSGTEEFGSAIGNDFDLAEYLGCVENGQSFRSLAGAAGVGTFGGSQDHAAILLGHADRLSPFSFAPLRHEEDFEFPADLAFVVAVSGVIAEKTGPAREKYNRLAAMVREVVAMVDPGLSLASIIDAIGVDELKRRVAMMPGSFAASDLLERVEQFRVENYEVIPGVADLLRSGDFAAIGEWVDTSHRNADRLLRNQTAETNFLQETARSNGALAASAFGAGFGGSVYALVRRSDAAAFGSVWGDAYRAKFPEHAARSEFFVTRPAECRLR